jgi:hypothetical protein
MINTIKQKKVSVLLRSFFPFFILTLIGLCSFVSVQASQGKVLAEIDGKKIMQKDFDAYLALFKGNSRYLPKTLEDKKRLLHHLIDRAILLEAARKEGYFKQDTLKKHPSFNQVEKETFVLRAYLMDHVSGKITVTSSEIAAFKKAHPRITPQEARNILTTKYQKIEFASLMKHLKSGRVIRIYPENFK